MWDKITDFLGGGLFSGAADLIKTYLPPDLTPAEKAEIERELQKYAHEKELKLQELTNEATHLLNERIAQQEGTAKDLKSIPFFGSVMIFLRGLQRPVWGFYTMYLDYVWFTASLEFTDKQEAGLIVINLLVLGFLFGERTVLNLQPLIERIFAKSK